MRTGFYFRSMLHDLRGERGRLFFFLSCLAVGVAAVVAVAGLARSLDGAIRGDARQLLAADLALEGDRPLSEALRARLARLPGAEQSEVRELVTIVAAPPQGEVPGASRLVELKAVAAGYPFYGRLETAPPRPLQELLGAQPAGPGDEAPVLGTVVAPDLLSGLGLAVGDELRIGGKPFRITATLVNEPDRIGGAFSIGPRVFVSVAGLESTALEQRGSRVEHRTLVKLAAGVSPEQLKQLAAELKELAGREVRVQTYAEAQPALRNGLRRVERFLGLVALLSLLAGGIGVAQTVRAWIAGRMTSIAVLKCLGLRPREVMALYFGQTLLLGLLGSAIGVAIGLAVMRLAPSLMGDFIPAGAIHLWQPAAIARGLVLGTAVALLFSIPPLAAAQRVPPVLVLRRDAEPLPASRWANLLALAGITVGVLGLATVQSRSLGLGLGFTLGLGGATAALTLAAWGVSRFAVHARASAQGRRLAVAQALATLARPGLVLGSIVALGLGILVVLAMSLVEGRLSGRLKADLPRNAPNVFLIDIQPEQWAGVQGLLGSEGAREVQSLPVITARLAAINGTSTEELSQQARDRGERRWALTREQRLTYAETLPADNQVIAGALWSLPDVAEVSLEKDFAEQLGVGLGSTLRFDIQGVPVELRVTSLRTVDWETFNLNFYLVAEPSALAAAPQQRVAAARLDREAQQRFQNALAARFPNVTLLDVRQILEKVSQVLDRVGLGVRLLGGFTVLAGIAILAGAVSAAQARRGREVALLKALGMTRWGVISVFSIEYSLIGLVAGSIGSVGAGILAWMVLDRGMEIPGPLPPAPFAVALVGGVALSVLAGLAASVRALGSRPIDALRQEV